jgi:hypothetical protein
MQITVKYEGEYYKSSHTDEVTAEEFKETLYNIAGQLDSFQMELEEGGYLVLASEAVKLCVFIIKDEEQ